MRLLESTLPKHVRLYVPDTPRYLFYKDAIYGGRVTAKNGHYQERISYADVVSSYPSSMKSLEHGYGKPIKVKKINWKRHGIYKVNLTFREDKEPDNFLQFVPSRTETGKLKWKWFKHHTGTYHTYDLLIAKDLGYEIECIEGIEFPKKGFILDKFVTNLFDLKDTHSKCNCKEHPCPIRMIAKIALNGGGYGKFVQKPVTQTVTIVERDIVADMYSRAERNEDGKIKVGEHYINPPTFINLDGEHFDKVILEQEDAPHYSTPCGISISSGSRYRLYLLCKAFPNMQVIYSDTDSIFVKASSVNEDAFAKACGTDLGSLENNIEGSADNTIKEMIILGPKMYAYKYTDTKDDTQIVFHAKGVPSKSLTWHQFEHLITSEDSTITFEFETIQRKLTTIVTRTINKDIKQT